MRSSLHHRLRRRWILTAPSVGARQTFMEGHPASRRRPRLARRRGQSGKALKRKPFARKRCTRMREAKVNLTTNEVLLAQIWWREIGQLISADRGPLSFKH